MEYEKRLPIENTSVIIDFITFLRTEFQIRITNIDKLPAGELRRVPTSATLDQFLEALRAAKPNLAGIKERLLNEAYLEFMVMGIYIAGENHYLWMYIEDSPQNRNLIDTWISEHTN